ncbi:MAG: WXG100 family type VII secretion target, partial [Bradyrhizobium sp.]
VRGILEAVGLMSILDRVTGNPSLLHAVGQTWLDQANTTNQVLTDLATGAKGLPQQWKGQASAAFGTFMENVASSTQSMGADMVVTAQILNDAGQECQLAQDMVVMIIREAAEWAAMTLAATALADIFTLGLASIAGGIAESAEMAAFVARATEVSVKLGEALAQLVEKIKELKGAAEAVQSAEGISDKLSEFNAGRRAINEIRSSGSILRAGNAIKDPFGYAWRFGFSRGFSALRGSSAAALAGVTGLPSGAGKFGLPPDIVPGGEGIITDDGNLNADAGILDKLSGTGPNFPSPYHESVSEMIEHEITLDEPPPNPG